VTRGVVVERGSEVGAARVASAQGALDFGRAGVVVELGFGESLE
jgi:hypothetical protein